MSASESLPVSMTIGLLKPFLRSSLQASRPSMSGRPTSSSTRSRCSPLTTSMPFEAVPAVDDLEFVVQCQLVLQRLAKVLVIVDDENLSRGAHADQLRCWDCCQEPRSLASDLRAETGFVRRPGRGRSTCERDAHARRVARSRARRCRPARTARMVAGSAALSFPCALGRGGPARAQARRRRRHARSGAGAAEVLYRPDRLRRPRTACRCVRSRPTDGWCDAPATATTIARCAIPIRRARSGCGATMGSTTSSSCSATTIGRACAAAAAPSSCMWHGPDTRRPTAALRLRAPITCCALLEWLGRGARRAASARLQQKTPGAFAPGVKEHVPGKWRARVMRRGPMERGPRRKRPQ